MRTTALKMLLLSNFIDDDDDFKIVSNGRLLFSPQAIKIVSLFFPTQDVLLGYNFISDKCLQWAVMPDESLLCLIHVRIICSKSCISNYELKITKLDPELCSQNIPWAHVKVNLMFQAQIWRCCSWEWLCLLKWHKVKRLATAGKTVPCTTPLCDTTLKIIKQVATVHFYYATLSYLDQIFRSTLK